MLIAERYRVGASLGRGGMGEVYRGTDEVLGRAVAIKLLLPSGGGPMAGERFQREARAAAMLSDPHLVAVYDFGQWDEGFYLVMELVEGRTVAAELAEHGPLTRDRAVDIVEQSAAGLTAAHRRDVVHRDIKPGNLLVAADGTVKVADFGIAHLPGAETTALTATGQIIGSTHYLAPERARGGQGGKPSDIYALGCVLYQLVIGDPPFTAEHPAAILYQHVDTAPTPPSRLRPELSGPFEDLLLRMLAKDPDDRPSADEVAAGPLRAAPLAFPAPTVRTTPLAAVDNRIADDANGLAAGAAVAAELAHDSGDAGPSPVVETRDPARRRYLLVAAIALVVTAGSVIAGAMLSDGKPPMTVDIGPRPSTKPSTPAPTVTRTATAPTQPAEASRTTPRRRATPRTATPSPRTSSPGTPPSTSHPATTTPPSATARPTTSPSASSTPSVNTPTPTADPSDTPTPTPSDTPAAATPTPATVGAD